MGFLLNLPLDDWIDPQDLHQLISRVREEGLVLLFRERVSLGLVKTAIKRLRKKHIQPHKSFRDVNMIGGGGLCSGTCVAVAPTRVIGGLPRDRASTVADGLRTGCSTRTQAILDDHDVERIVVDETDIIEAMRVVWARTKQVIEPSAAVAFAAARAAGLDGARVGIVCSGGNVDLDALPW